MNDNLLLWTTWHRFNGTEQNLIADDISKSTTLVSDTAWYNVMANMYWGSIPLQQHYGNIDLA